MFFKNLQIFQLLEPWKISPEDLHEKMYLQRARECGKMDMATFGWTEPLGESGNLLNHVLEQYVMITAKKETKVLPTSVVREEAEKRVAEIEKEENRKVGSKQKSIIREQVIFSLLPQAFSCSELTYAYIDTKAGLLLVDTTKAALAEEITVLLRKSLGTLPLTRPEPRRDPSSILTNWLLENDTPREFEIDNFCEMIDPTQLGRSIRFSNHDLTIDEVRAHLRKGKIVKQLAFTWQERIFFVLASDMSVKRIKFLEVVQDQAEEVNAETPEQKFDVDFAIMAGEFSMFLTDLLSAFGISQAQTDHKSKEAMVA